MLLVIFFRKPTLVEIVCRTRRDSFKTVINTVEALAAIGFSAINRDTVADDLDIVCAVLLVVSGHCARNNAKLQQF